ncbi:DivIVA domain-containing protein [uncultured Pseudokineococcus sp.]|uniref:DivIVA domain-containing protein n=1 Tax=uncultured Pseudokineococcus sp. TaxID=1642928 RepID=UPI00261FA10B|nr:DivIVA domain-containing protein [uncultured Pseudokineococcus sp.]
MVLTPEAVTERTFTQTQFRHGYAVEEVDDFLDEVVGELTRLRSENDGLREQLADAERRAEEAASARDEAPAQHDAPAQEAVPAPAVPAQATAPEDAMADEGLAGGSAAPGAAGSAAGVLALAQRLHDEHVRAGEEQRDRLVGDASAEAERLVTEAQEQRRTTLEQLEEQRTSELGALERERTLLERKIDELRGFEREYRSRLRAYLEGQLRDLDGTAAVVPGSDGTATTGSPS